MRLRKLFRTSTLRWTLVVLLAAPPVLLAFVLMTASLFDVHIALDLAAIVYAAAAVIVALTVFHVARYWMRPKRMVTVGYNYRFIQPAVTLGPVGGRYSFRLEVFYELDEKGERATIQQSVVELKFRGKDHPDILRWCCSRVSEHLARHGELAATRYPGARVLLAPEPTPAEIERHVVVVGEEPRAGATGKDPVADD